MYQESTGKYHEVTTIVPRKLWECLGNVPQKYWESTQEEQEITTHMANKYPVAKVSPDKG